MSDYVEPILLVGAGQMAIQYSKVLSFLRVPFQVVGRGQASAVRFTQMTGKAVRTGGLDAFMHGANAASPSYAIAAVDVEQLEQTAQKLIERNIPNILLEKPGGMTLKEMKQIQAAAVQKGINVYIAYNRRYLSTAAKAKEWIDEDGGLTSFHFEFTERAELVAGLGTPERVKNNWVIANSTHVIDLAFFLGGMPNRMDCYTAGSLDWHRHAAIFAGAGRTKTGALFTYKADWQSTGNWQIELMTPMRRIQLNPLERLNVTCKKERSAAQQEQTDKWDEKFKPGLFRMVSDFLSGSPSKRLVTIQEQVWNTENVYVPMQQNSVSVN